MSDVPLVTVVVPARNEVADIARCLQAVLAQDHPHDRMEVVVVDGGSGDGTADRAKAILATGDIRWSVVENPVGTTPSNLNAGLRLALGQVLCRVDARSIVPENYVSLCVDVLERHPDVAVTGGAQTAVATTDSSRSVGIARALNNRYVMGGARYRSGAASGPTDTVYLGAFRTEQLRATGGWDEAMLTNQDYELNRRLGDRGVVWFDERLSVAYRPRQTFADLLYQYHRFGRWKVRYWRRSGHGPQSRQWTRMLAGFSTLGGIVVVLGWPGPAERRLGGFAAFGAAILLFVDHAGTAGPQARTTADRLAAALAICLVGGGWTLGVAHEVLSGRPGPRVRS